MKKKAERGIMSHFDLNERTNLIVYIMMVLMIVVMGCTMLYPIIVTFLNAFKTNPEVIAFPPKFLPSAWQWSNFVEGWHYIPLPVYFKNTMLMFVGSMVSIVIVIGLAAFSLSKLRLPRRNLIIVFFMSTLFIPPTTYIIPNFINLRDLGLMNTYWAFWLPAGANAFFMLLLKTFFDEVNNELLEAAKMDGASDLRTFMQIALPLSIPIFATLAIFTFAATWNDWFWPSLILHGDSRYPIATAIYKNVINIRRMDLNIRFTILTMVMVPPIVVFLIFQKFIIRGLQVSGVKG